MIISRRFLNANSVIVISEKMKKDKFERVDAVVYLAKCSLK